MRFRYSRPLQKSPFVHDVAERVGSSFLGGMVTYFVEYMVENEVGLVHLRVEVRGILFALGVGLFSAIKARIAKPFGSKGTASLSRVVTYDPAAISAPDRAK